MIPNDHRNRIKQAFSIKHKCISAYEKKKEAQQQQNLSGINLNSVAFSRSFTVKILPLKWTIVKL